MHSKTPENNGRLGLGFEKQRITQSFVKEVRVRGLWINRGVNLFSGGAVAMGNRRASSPL